MLGLDKAWSYFSLAVTYGGTGWHSGHSTPRHSGSVPSVPNPPTSISKSISSAWRRPTPGSSCRLVLVVDGANRETTPLGGAQKQHQSQLGTVATMPDDLKMDTQPLNRCSSIPRHFIHSHLYQLHGHAMIMTTSSWRTRAMGGLKTV